LTTPTKAGVIWVEVNSTPNTAQENNDVIGQALQGLRQKGIDSLSSLPQTRKSYQTSFITSQLVESIFSRLLCLS